MGRGSRHTVYHWATKSIKSTLGFIMDQQSEIYTYMYLCERQASKSFCFFLSPVCRQNDSGMLQWFDYHTVMYLQEVSIFLDNIPNSLMFLPRKKITTVLMQANIRKITIIFELRRKMYRYWRGHGFKSHSGLHFF